MKAIILTGLFFTGLFSFAQTKTKDALGSIDVCYGNRVYFEDFYNELNTTTETKIGRPVQIIAIGMSGRFLTKNVGSFNGHIMYSHVIPQTIQIQDTIKGKITGFIFSYSYGRIIRSKSKKFGLYYYTGFNTGRLRIYNNEIIRQKNPFFSPKVGIQPKIKLGKIGITCIVEAEFDISKPNWRRTYFANENKINLNKLRQSCLTWQLGVCYIL